MSPRKPAKRRATTSKRPLKKARPSRARPTLVDAAPERCFWVNFGPILKNLRELGDALASDISDAQFAHHVGPEKNDFATWVENVLGDEDCAQALRRARTRRGTLRAVRARLKAYS